MCCRCTEKAYAQSLLPYPCLWCYFEPGHGKGLVDAEGGLAKRACTKEQARAGGQRIFFPSQVAAFLAQRHCAPASASIAGRSKGSKSSAPLNQRFVYLVRGGRGVEGLDPGVDGQAIPEYVIPAAPRPPRGGFRPIKGLRGCRAMFTFGTAADGGAHKGEVYTSEEACPCENCRWECRHFDAKRVQSFVCIASLVAWLALPGTREQHNTCAFVAPCLPYPKCLPCPTTYAPNLFCCLTGWAALTSAWTPITQAGSGTASCKQAAQGQQQGQQQAQQCSPAASGTGKEAPMMIMHERQKQLTL